MQLKTYLFWKKHGIYPVKPFYTEYLGSRRAVWQTPELQIQQ